MFSVPSEYHRLIVRPSVDRFLNEPTAFDLCFAACIFLSHFCDVFAEHHEISVEQARKRVTEADRSLIVILAVATAAKHVVVRNARMGDYQGLMAEHATVGKSAAFSDGTYFSDGTSFAEHDDVVQIQTPDGNLHDLTHLVQSLDQTIQNFFLDKPQPRFSRVKNSALRGPGGSST